MIIYVDNDYKCHAQLLRTAISSNGRSEMTV